MKRIAHREQCIVPLHDMWGLCIAFCASAIGSAPHVGKEGSYSLGKSLLFGLGRLESKMHDGRIGIVAECTP